MKKSLYIGAIALLISGSLAAQTNMQAQAGNRTTGQDQQQKQKQEQLQGRTGEQIKEQERILKQEVKNEKKQAKIEARLQKQELKAEKKQAKIQARIEKQELKAEKKQAKIEARTQRANHGTAVSETARNTESGPGKGEVVSTQAKSNSVVKQAKPSDSGKAASKKAAKGTALKTGKGKMPVGR